VSASTPRKESRIFGIIVGDSGLRSYWSRHLEVEYQIYLIL